VVRCVPKLTPFRGDKENQMEEYDKSYKILEEAYRLFRNNQIMRLNLTGAANIGSRMKKDFKTHIEFMLQISDIRQTPIKLADAQYVLSHIKEADKASKRIAYAGEGQFRSDFMRSALLPRDLFNRQGMGKLFEVIGEYDAIKDQKLARSGHILKQLQGHMDSLHNLSTKKAQKKIQDVTDKYAIALSKYMRMKDQNIENPGTFTKDQMANANSEVQKSKEQQEALWGVGAEGDPAVRLLRELGKALDTGDLVRLQKNMKGMDSGQLRDIYNTAVEFVSEFKKVYASSTEATRTMIQHELEPIFGETEAAKMAKNIVPYKEITEYYPHRNLISLFHAADRVVKVQTALDTGVAKDDLRSMVASWTTGHARERHGGKSPIDWNSLGVLSAYAQEMVEYEHAARVGSELSKYMKDLGNLRVVKDAIMNGDDQNPYFQYAGSVRKMLIAYSHQIFDKKIGTIFDETVNTAAAFQVLTKLVNPATSMNNRLEGILQYVSYFGDKNNYINGLLKTHGKELGQIKSEAHTDFRVQSLIDMDITKTQRSKLQEVLTDKDIDSMESINAEKARLGLQVARKGVSKAASLGLKYTLWEGNENRNRQESFDRGAVEALHYINTKWKSRFVEMGDIPDYLVRNFKLDRGRLKDAKDNKEGAREELWNEFKKKYAIRQGFRAMFQTQFQYSASARSILDLNPKTRLLTMFQHYPRSLASVIAWDMWNVKNLFQVGGFKGVFQGNKQGRVFNRDLQRILSVGAIAAIRNVVRFKTGWVLGNLMVHPIAEVMSDLISYFNDDDPEHKGDKAWQLMYGYDQPVRRFTGPFFSEAADALSLGMIKAGIDDTTMPEWLASTLGLLGARPNEEALTLQGRRNYSTAWDVVRETLLWDATAVLPKSAALARSVMDWNMQGASMEALRMVGIRPDWKQVSEKRREESIRNI